MSEWEDGLDSEPEISEEQSEQLYKERLEEIELQIERDECPPEPDVEDGRAAGAEKAEAGAASRGAYPPGGRRQNTGGFQEGYRLVGQAGRKPGAAGAIP